MARHHVSLALLLALLAGGRSVRKGGAGGQRGLGDVDEGSCLHSEIAHGAISGAASSGGAPARDASRQPFCPACRPGASPAPSDGERCAAELWAKAEVREPLKWGAQEDPWAAPVGGTASGGGRNWAASLYKHLCHSTRPPWRPAAQEPPEQRRRSSARARPCIKPPPQDTRRYLQGSNDATHQPPRPATPLLPPWRGLPCRAPAPPHTHAHTHFSHRRCMYHRQSLRLCFIHTRRPFPSCQTLVFPAGSVT